jgi:hypothetical protein
MRKALGEIARAYTGPLYYDRAHFGSEHLLEGLSKGHADQVASVSDLSAVARVHRVIIGHYSAATLLAAGCTALALQVREPRSRLLSLYRFWEAQSPEEKRSWGRWGSDLVEEAQRSLKEFLGSAQVWPATDNAVSRQVAAGGDSLQSGRQRHAEASQWFTASGYRSVRRSLVVVGWADQSSDFLTRICDVAGAKEVPVLMRENTAAVHGEPQEIDAGTLHLLERLTREDSMLLGQLMADGHLQPRSGPELDREFLASAERLGFRVMG